jgi:hypothetical protein
MLGSFITCTVRQNYQVKEDQMGRVCSTDGEGKFYRVLAETPEGKRSLRIHMRIILKWILE